MRRLLPFLLVTGVVFLGWGLSSLARIFNREQDDALEALSAERWALEQFASDALRSRLHAAMEERRATFDAMALDPDLPVLGAFQAVDGLQRLPRPPEDSPLEIPTTLLSPALLKSTWYLEPQSDGSVRGVAVDLPALTAAVAGEMRSRGLLEPKAVLRLPVEPLISTPQLQVEVERPRWQQAARDIQARHRLKSLLLLSCGGLALGIVSLAAFYQWRKQRFLELKSDFIATVSHELRTPLASIRLLGETLSKRMAAMPEAKDYPDRIVREADGLSFLVENILSFNRIGKGRWQIRRSQVSLDELFSNLRTTEPEKNGPPLILEVETGGLVLDGDPTLLQLLFSNLLRNARTYNLRSPVHVRVQAQPGTEPVVLFSDNGVGIPPGEWERVFDEFYRLPAKDLEVHGSGLGLTLCRRILALHGGRIRIQSSGPEGTTFELIFPRSRA